MKKWLFAFFLLLLGVDVISKMAALELVPPIRWLSAYPFGGIGLFQFGSVTFSLNFVTNTGAAWGVFAEYSGFLFAARLVIISSLAIFLLFFNKGKISAFPMWFVLTGAVGNAIDYWIYGHVIDFFHFTFWGWSFPVFNMADFYITLGAIGFLLSTRSKQAVSAP
jgi:signal peptidase II